MKWLELLKAEIAAHGGQITPVAKKLAYSRTAISLASRGKYPGKTDKIEARVLARLGTLECPYNNQMISYGECRSMRERQAPTHNLLLLRYWKACQSCPNNPQASGAGQDDTPLQPAPGGSGGYAARIPVEEMA